MAINETEQRQHRVSRRDFLRVILAVGGAAFTGELLAGCMINSAKSEADGLLLDGEKFLRDEEDVKAITNFGKAYDLYSKMDGQDGRLGEIVVLGDTAAVRMVNSDYQRGFTTYEKAIGVFESQKDPDPRFKIAAVSLYSGLGMVYAKMGNYQTGMAYQQKAVSVIQQLDAPGAFSFADTVTYMNAIKNAKYVTYSNTGVAQRNMGDYEKSLANFQAALKIVEGGDETATKFMYGQIGMVYLDQGNIESAKNFIGKSGNNLALGMLALAQNAYPAAIECFNKELSATSANKGRHYDQRIASYIGLGRAYKNTGETELADDNYTEALSLANTIASNSPSAERKNFINAKFFGLPISEAVEGSTALVY